MTKKRLTAAVGSHAHESQLIESAKRSISKNEFIVVWDVTVLLFVSFCVVQVSCALPPTIFSQQLPACCYGFECI